MSNGCLCLAEVTFVNGLYLSFVQFFVLLKLYLVSYVVESHLFLYLIFYLCILFFNACYLCYTLVAFYTSRSVFNLLNISQHYHIEVETCNNA